MIYTIKEYALIDPQKSDAAEATHTSNTSSTDAVSTTAETVVTATEVAPAPAVKAPAQPKKATRARATAKASPAAQPAAKPVAKPKLAVAAKRTATPAKPTPSVTTVTAKVASKVKPVATPKVKSADKKASTPTLGNKVAPKAEKVKAKLIRDSFTMPREDWDLIQYLKERALAFQRPTKKSELLRAGLQVLVGLSDAKLQAALERLTPLKAGRPKGSGK
ncbi:hypothetical protein [Aquabacterium sp.]|uniref:hypothetical protein n=1 Tax=Aquabacterium sp. TaxID=1872578 RepID=UPI0027B90092|nr:hypothetical protein [Aquabacterium sp.]